MSTDKASAYFNRGVAYEAQGNVSLAIESYTQAIKLFPNATDKARPYFNRGIVLWSTR